MSPMLSYVATNENNVVAVHNRLNNDNNSIFVVSGNFVNNNNSSGGSGSGMTTGSRNNNTATLTRSRSSNEDELRKMENNNVQVLVSRNGEGQQQQNRRSPRRSSLTSPQHHLRRNCLVRSYNCLNNKNDHELGSKTIKQPNLKRVSFGSSKGSMVETLIYDHHQDEEWSAAYRPSHNYYHPPPLLHHHHYHTPRRNGYYRANILANGHANKSPLHVTTPEEESPSKGETEPSVKPARVKVTFLESQKPDVVTSPESPCPSYSPSDLNVPLIMSTPTPEKSPVLRQGSMDSGNENPFRPDGELSKEADSIVELIKEGKPITPTKGDGVTENGVTSPDGTGAEVQEDFISPQQVNSVESAKPGTNGTTPQTITVEPGSVDVQHGVVSPPGDAVQVEHVNIKKKPKCKCCVIQ